MDPDETDHFNMRQLLQDQLVSLQRALAFNQAISERLLWQSSLLTGPVSPAPALKLPELAEGGGMLTPSGQSCHGERLNVVGAAAKTAASMLSPSPPPAPLTWQLPTSPTLASEAPEASEAGGNEATSYFEDGRDDPETKVHADGMHVLHEPPISVPDIASVVTVPASIPREKVKKPRPKKDRSKFVSEPPASGNNAVQSSGPIGVLQASALAPAPAPAPRASTSNCAGLGMLTSPLLSRSSTGSIPLMSRAGTGISADGKSSWKPRFMTDPVPRLYTNPNVWNLEEPLLHQKAVAVMADEESEQDKAKPEHKSRVPEKKRFVMSIAEMKRRVRDCLHEEPYRETDFYSTTGPYQELARNEYFHNVCIAMVVANVIWIGIDIDLNKADVLCNAPLIFQLVDNIFCVFFTFEMSVRLLAFRDRASAFQEAQFLFDFLLAMMVVWECWIQVLMYKLLGSATAGSQSYSALRVVRLVRLTRAARIAKLLDFLPELRILVKGFLLAIRSTFTIVLFLALVIYVFSLVFTQVLGDCMVGSSSFESVPATMNFFLLQVLCGFDSQFLNDLLAIHWTYYLLFLLYLFISQMALMNMLTGVICEVVSAVSEVEEQESFMLQAVERLGGVLHALDIDGNNKIDKEELESLLGNKKLLLILKDEGIDVVGLVDLVPFLFRDHDELRINEVLEFLIQYRGSKTATVRDLVEVRQFISMEIRRWAFEQHGMMLPVETSRTLTQDPLDAS
eukprot:TRINITY_DN24361_c0_g1_i3.p1 TRINITY_DN24361_c0_g1~~TRINITY_DN24361_c0_g1_i3.p1  ORF type:complete len:750 (+),score=135.63 TRINITY_DN24361_c0_g1_i3:41-2251(+)